MSNETVAVKTEVPAEGQVKVVLSRINNRHFKNSRHGIGTSLAMSELVSNIKAQGLLVPVLGTWSEDGSEIWLVAGYRRTEAMQQIALKSLVKDFNDKMGYKPGDADFVDLQNQDHRERIRDTSPEWAEKYKEALDKLSVEVRTSAIADTTSARIKNLVENEVREDFTLAELCDTIRELLDEGVKQKDIAKGMSKTDAAISQLAKIARMPKLLAERFEKGIPELKLAESDKQKMLAEYPTAIEELERRIALPKGHTQAIPFSHMRDFAAGFDHKTDPLSLTSSFNLLRDLVRLGPQGNATEIATMDYGVFKAKLADARQETKKLAEAPAETKAETKPSGDGQAAEKPEVSTGKTESPPPAAAVPAAQTVQEIAQQQQKPTLTAEDEVNAQIIAEANAAESVAEDKLQELADASDEDEATKAAKAAEKKEKEVTGETRTSTKEAPSVAYRMMDAPNIENMAVQFVNWARTDETATICDREKFLFSAQNLYDILGMKDQANAIGEVELLFVEKLNAYVKTLEEFFATKATDAEKKSLAELYPSVK